MALRLVNNHILKHGIKNLLESRQLYVYDRHVNKLFIVGFKSGRISLSETKKAPNKDANHNSTGTELDVARKNPYADMTMGQKVKEASKDFTYLVISVAALGVLGALFYYIGRELFSSSSSSGVYNKALKRCMEDSEVTVTFGYDIKAFGEETRRRRRNHVSHMEFIGEDGRKHMRMMFHIEGSGRSGKVNLEVVENDSGVYDYRYLFVQLDQFPYKTIIVEDNR